MTGIEFLQGLSLVLAVLISLCYCYQVLYLFIPILMKRRSQKEPVLRKYAILIAARNEEAVLPHLLDSLHAQDYPAELMDIFVVADNCTDATAEVAEKGGATVITRFNKQFVGKGYAIRYLLDYIQKNIGLSRYDAFLIFDADNLLRPDYISKINQLPSDGYEAFCGYRNTKNFGTNWITSGYGLWYLHESSHMNRSRYVLGVSCAVNGTGFGFTRELLERIGDWNFFTLTEDIEFNNWCVTNGVKVGYCHDVILYDEQPLTFAQSWTQRTRWAQGGIQVSLKYACPLFRSLFKGKWISWSALELATLSLWGYGLAAIAGCLSLLVTFLTQGTQALAVALILALAGTYFSMFGTALWTLIPEWKRIHATTAQKIRSAFTFPFYMITYAPIALCSFFRKFHWEPIKHTVAISASDLVKK